MGNCRRSAPHLFELSSKDSSEVGRYIRIDRLYRSPDRCCSGAVQRHTSAEVCEPKASDRYL